MAIMIGGRNPIGGGVSDFAKAPSAITANNAVFKAQRMGTAIMNAERPSNLWYKVTDQTTYWYVYALMDWYRSEVSIFSTIILRSTTELLRHGITFRPRFARKCDECGYESQSVIRKCPVCGSYHMRMPDPTQKDYFRRPNGRSFIDEANDNGQSLLDVVRAYTDSEYQNNQAYMLCVTGDFVDPMTGRLQRAFPLEFIAQDPKFVKNLFNDTGKPGVKWGFTRDNRNMLINLVADDEVEDNRSAMERVLDLDMPEVRNLGMGSMDGLTYDDEVLDAYTRDGKELYPAYWQIGSSYGATGEYWLYTQEEVYQDQWFRPSLTYGMPIALDIEDDLLTYHYIEKHNLKKYKYGYVRSILFLPGFSDDDVEDITKGIKDILATNDNSIPIVCPPPQMPGTAEMKAQNLELGTESSQDLMIIKNDIRDRLTAIYGVPNLFAGDVEASGGMNNESQQITVFDRYLMDKYDRLDRLLGWFLSWFPLITDWELVINRPSKAYTDAKRRLDKIQEAQLMKSLGFEIFMEDGEFRYSEEPMDQIDRREQKAMAKAQAEQQAEVPPEDGMLPGDGEGPPERDSARRADDEIDESKNEVELSERESAEAAEV